MCRFDFQAVLNETGIFNYLIAPEEEIELLSLPSPEALLKDLNLAAAAVTTGSREVSANLSEIVEVGNLPSETSFLVLLSAQDASEIPNFFESIVVLNVSTPDITPPKFTGKYNPTSFAVS